MNELTVKIMIMKRKFLSLFLVAMLLVCAVPVKDAQAKKIKLNTNKLTLEVGDTAKLKVIGAKGKVKWKSSNKSIVKVNSKGKISAKKAGKAKITATNKGKKLVCKVTVESDDSENITPPDAVTNQSPAPVQSPDSGLANPSYEPLPAASPSSSTLAAKQQLKNYIVQYGETDSDGNKYIYSIQNSESGDSSYTYFRIEYDADKYCFNFGVMYMYSKNSSSILTFDIPELFDRDIVNISALYDYQEQIYGESALYLSTYTTEEALYFDCPSVDDSFFSIANELFNSILVLGITGWDGFVLDNTGVTLRDLGFVNII